MSEPILYILMRKDLPSMNAGKAMAQASHASNAFIYKSTFLGSGAVKAEVVDWCKTTNQGFGTVLVLAATLQEIADVMSSVQRTNANIPSGTVVDPSYPYRADAELASLIPVELDTIPRQVNGNQVTLWRKETTCAYVFGTKEELAPILGHLPLHP